MTDYRMPSELEEVPNVTTSTKLFGGHTLAECKLMADEFALPEMRDLIAVAEECERLRAELAVSKAQQSNAADILDEVCVKRDQLRAENEQLREDNPTAPMFLEICAEVDRATTKFPLWPTDALHAVSVVAEEMGELQKEVVQLTYEPHKSTKESVKKEALHLAAMTLRFLTSLDRYEYEPRPQHSQNAARRALEETKHE
jgi:hypothetical protein